MYAHGLKSGEDMRLRVDELAQPADVRSQRLHVLRLRWITHSFDDKSLRAVHCVILVFVSSLKTHIRTGTHNLVRHLLPRPCALFPHSLNLYARPPRLI